jgi:hypothetical protein
VGGAPRIDNVNGRGLMGLVTANSFPIVLAALIAGVLSFLSPSLFVADSWMTLVGGREVVAHGIPHHEALTIWASGRRWIDQQWLAQLFWYGVDSAAGLRAVALTATLLVVATFVGAMAAARQLGATARSTFLVSFVALFAAPWSWQVRAQTLALPLFVLTVWLTAAHAARPSRRILWSLPLLVFWANLHGSVLLGGAIVALTGIVVAARKPTIRSVSSAFGLSAAAALCSLVTPYGTEILDYYRLMLLHPPFARLLTEWQRTTPSGITAAFFVVAVVTAVVCLLQRARLRMYDTLILVITLVGALQALRGIVWFVLAVMVLVPRLLDGVISRPDVVQMPKANAALAAVSVVAAVAAVTIAALKPAGWFERNWPSAALAAVNSAGPEARVLASDRHADWLLWRLPSLKGRLAYDVRFELYTKSQITRISRFDYVRGRDWASIADGYNVVVVDEQSHRQLAERLVHLSGIALAYRDPRIAVFVRRA